MQIYDDNPLAPSLDLENVEVYNDVGRYVGTKLDLKTAFPLTHNVGGTEFNIFRRQFNGNEDAGSGGGGINLTNNTVDIPDHFFVTGEKVTYSYTGATSLNAVGIQATSVGGVSTDKLPTDLYVVKINSNNNEIVVGESDKDGKIFVLNFSDYVTILQSQLADYTRLHFTAAQVWSVFAQLLRGVAHLHARGVIHRDLKTLNVLLCAKRPGHYADGGDGAWRTQTWIVHSAHDAA